MASNMLHGVRLTLPVKVSSQAAMRPFSSPPSLTLTRAQFVKRPVAVPVHFLVPQPKRTSADVLAPPTPTMHLDPYVFNEPLRRDILHLCVTHYLDSLRQGSSNTKTRAEVAGSGIKIRPQKGSGKARLGDGQSPMLRGGGVAFGPKPRDFATKLPRKVQQMGMRVALSSRVREGGLLVADSLQWPEPKTKGLKARLTELDWFGTLFVTGHAKIPEFLRRASSNLKKVAGTPVTQLSIHDLLKYRQVVMDREAISFFTQVLGKQSVTVEMELEDSLATAQFSVVADTDNEDTPAAT